MPSYSFTHLWLSDRSVKMLYANSSYRAAAQRAKKIFRASGGRHQLSLLTPILFEYVDNRKLVLSMEYVVYIHL